MLHNLITFGYSLIFYEPNEAVLATLFKVVVVCKMLTTPSGFLLSFDLLRKFNAFWNLARVQTMYKGCFCYCIASHWFRLLRRIRADFPPEVTLTSDSRPHVTPNILCFWTIFFRLWFERQIRNKECVFKQNFSFFFCCLNSQSICQ